MSTESQQQISREAATEIIDDLKDETLTQNTNEWINAVQAIILSAIELAYDNGYEDCRELWRKSLVKNLGEPAAQPPRSEPDRLELAREALSDWRSKKLSDGAALFAISIALTPQRAPTQAEIDHAKTIIERIKREKGSEFKQAAKLIVDNMPEREQPPATDDFAPFFKHCEGKSNAELEAMIEAAPRGEQEWSKAGTHCIKIGDRNVHFYEVRDRDLCIDNHNASLKANNLRGGVESRHAESPGLETHASGSGALDRPSRGRTGNDLGSGSSAPPSQKKAAPRREQAEQQDWRHMKKAHKEVKLIEQQLLAERQLREQAEQIQHAEKQILLDKIARNKSLSEQLLSAQSAIEKHNNAPLPDCPWGKIEVDLSALHQHDAEVRKPLVDALKLLANEDNYLVGFNPCRVASYALSKVKE